MAGEVSFFELGVKDAAKAREFYGELFGWRMKPGPSGEQHGFQIETENISGGVHGACRDNQGSSFGLHQPPA